jgi:DegV family protein with EDD domain
MGRVAVVTDTTQYLPAELTAERELHLVSLYVRWGDELEAEAAMPDFDGFYARLRSAKDLPTTSQPSIGDFLAVYEPLLADGRDIVSVHLSAGLSGTYDSAVQAAAELAERGFAGRVRVVDSATTAGGLAMVALAAAAKAAAGASMEDVAAHALEARAAMRIWFAVDTLEYLRRGGRIGAAQAWVGGALRIKPILSLESQVTQVERVRTSAKAFERMVEYLRTLRDDGADAWMVQHIRAPEDAERLVARGRELFGTEPIAVSEIGAVVGTHAGPGLVGVGGLPRRFLEPAAG